MPWAKTQYEENMAQRKGVKATATFAQCNKIKA